MKWIIDIVLTLGLFFLACLCWAGIEWNIIKEHTIPSAIASMAGRGQQPKGEVSNVMLAEKYILILECAHCGQIDKTIEITPV